MNSDLDKLQMIAENMGYFPPENENLTEIKNQHKTIFQSKSYFPTLFAFCSGVTVITLSFFNPCLEYQSVLYIVFPTMFSIAFVFAFVQLMITNKRIAFCNDDQRLHHSLHTVNLFSSMCLSYSALNSYVYDVTFWWILLNALLVFVILFEYFAVYWNRHHFNYCELNKMESGSQKKEKHDKLYAIFSVVAFFFMAIWVSMLFLIIALDYKLLDDRETLVNSNSCLPITRDNFII